jgi:glutathione S-transferase
MKLHGVYHSPFVRMTMVTAIECGLGDKVQSAPVMLKPQEVDANLAALSPIGKIPVLEREDAHALYDSRVIMEFLCNEAANTTLLPTSAQQRFRVLTTLALAQGIAEAAVNLRYETFARPEEKRWPELVERQKARLVAGLDELEREGNDILQGVTLASIAAACTLSYIDLRELYAEWRTTRPLLAQWHKAFCARESMLQTTPR